MKAHIKITLKNGVLDPQGKAIASALGSLGFGGVDGLIWLHADGLSERALAILEVNKIGSTVVEAAPATLDGARLSATTAPPRVN